MIKRSNIYSPFRQFRCTYEKFDFDKGTKEYSKKYKAETGMTSEDVYVHPIERGGMVYDSGLFLSCDVMLSHFQPTFSYGGTVMNAKLFHEVSNVYFSFDIRFSHLFYLSYVCMYVCLQTSSTDRR